MAGLLCFRFPQRGLAALLAVALFALPALRAERFRVPLLLVFFAAGFVFAYATDRPPLPPERIPAWAEAAVTPDGENTSPGFAAGVTLSGTIRENTPLADNRTRILLDNVHAANESDPLPGALVLTWRNPPPDLARAGPGQKLTATLRLREIRGFANPEVWETERFWRDQGAYFRAWNRDDGAGSGKTAPYALAGESSTAWQWRDAARARAIAALADETDASGRNGPRLSQPAAIILALLFGDRSFCAPEMLDLVARATLAHSLALSGMHLGFAAGLGYGAAYFLSFLFPSLFLRLPRQKAGILMALPPAAAYLWLGGAPPSLQRAALMLLFWGVLLWLNKPKVLLDGLIWAVAVILVFSPAALHDIRLQLSAISVAGIALATPLLRRAIMRISKGGSAEKTRAPRHFACALAGMAGISVAAQLAVLPLVLDAFPGTGFWFPLNLVWLPALGFLVMPLAFAGLLLSSLGLAGAASGVFLLAELPCSGLLGLLQAMDGLGILVSPVALRPTWPAMAGYWTLLLLVPVAYTARALSRRALLLLSAGLILAAGPSLHAAIAARRDMVSLKLLDVGQGQAVLVTWQGKNAKGRMLVDGGGFASGAFDVGRQVVTPVLTANAAPRLDWIVNSHPDADHLQGLLFPLAAFRIGNAAFAPDPGQKRTQIVVRRDAILERRGIMPRLWRAGDAVTLAPGLVLEVLHPGNDPGLSRNNSALVLRLVRDGRPLALICGDVEKQGIARMLERGPRLEADVLILPHHGSGGSFSPKLYDAVKPKLALAACGYANPWHFPARTVREGLASRRIPLLTTADKGQITVTWENGMRVETAR